MQLIKSHPRDVHPRDVRARVTSSGSSGSINGFCPSPILQRVSFRRERRVTGNWGDIREDDDDDDDEERRDRLYDLGGSQNYNINVDHGELMPFIPPEAS